MLPHSRISTIYRQLCYNWYVHVDPVKPEGDFLEGCNNVGPHYNPYNVNVKVRFQQTSSIIIFIMPNF